MEKRQTTLSSSDYSWDKRADDINVGIDPYGVERDVKFRDMDASIFDLFIDCISLGGKVLQSDLVAQCVES